MEKEEREDEEDKEEEENEDEEMAACDIAGNTHINNILLESGF